MVDDQVQVVDINAIVASPFQPRQDSFEEEELKQLALTIKEVGLIHPPSVRQTAENQYQLIAGERRYRAALIAGLTKIPVLVQATSDDKSSMAALVENIQRVDLNPVELAEALVRLSESLKLTQEALSQKVGLKRSSIANYFRLLSLPVPILDALRHKKLSLGHAKVILSVDSSKNQVRLYRMILALNLSVRESEDKAKSFGSKKKVSLPKKQSGRNIFIEQIKETLQRKMGTRIDFHGNEKKGSIELHYYSLSDLNRLLQELGYSETSH